MQIGLINGGRASVDDSLTIKLNLFSQKLDVSHKRNRQNEMEMKHRQKTKCRTRVANT